MVELRFGEVLKGTTFYLSSCSSNRSRCFAKYTPGAAILAPSQSVDEVVLLREAFSTIFGTEVQTMVIFDSKDLRHALSSKRNTMDKYVHPDVNCIKIYFETVIHVYSQIYGSLKPAEGGTKIKSALTENLPLILETGMLQIGFTECEFCNQDKSYG